MLGVLSLSAGYAALVLYSASWPAAAALRTSSDWQPRAYTAGEFYTLRRVLAGLAAVAGGLGFGLGLAPTGHRELAALGQELAGVVRKLAQAWRALRPGQRRGALAGLATLTALRLYYSLTLQVYDDAMSYELFVRESWLTVNAAYLRPNNHVGSNALDWLFYQVSANFWWSMRVPVLLASTGATGLWFLALLWRANFRVALLAVSLFSMLQVSFYHAVQGRGYWLLVGLGAVGFLAVLELSAAAASPRYPRAAALSLVLSGVLGLYVVPTHAYFLFSAYSWLGLMLLLQRAWRPLGRALGLGALTLLGAGLLYAPVLLLSGPHQLLANDYLRPMAPGEFWRTILVYVWYNEGNLSGYRWLGARPLQLVLLGLAVLWVRARRGQLTPTAGRLVTQLGLPSAWFVGAPYLLVLGQRLQPPERTLFYKAQWLAVLAALLLDWGLQQLGQGPRRWALGLLGGAGLAFAVGQAQQLETNDQARQRWPGATHYRAGAAWLAAQPPGPVLLRLPPGESQGQLRFYAHADFRHRAWQLDGQPQPGVRYRYLVARPAEPARYAGRLLVGPPAFQNSEINIFVLPNSQPTLSPL
ncbi:MAG: hypothetical protein ACRYF0_15830 [Janthinobacterium lividum]